MTDRLLIALATAIYASGFLVALVFFWRARRYPRWLMPGLMVVGFAVHNGGLFWRGYAIGHCPLGNTFEVIQFVVWSLVLCYLAIGPAFRLSLLGSFCAALATLLSGLSLLMPGWDVGYTVNIFGNDPRVEAHAAIAAFSYGVLGLLTLTAMMAWWQTWSLERRPSDPVPRFLPSVFQLEKINLRLLLLAFAVLSLGVMMGFALGAEDWSRVPLAKLITTVLVWLAYGVVLGLRLRGQLVAKPFAVVLIVLFGCALVALWVVDHARLTPLG